MATIKYQDDFNAYALNQAPPSPWVATPSVGGAVEVVSDPEAGAPQGRVVRIFDNGSDRSTLQLESTALGTFNDLVLEFRFRAAQTNRNLYVGVKDLDGNFDNIIVIRSDGTLGYVNPVEFGNQNSTTISGTTYVADTWYKVKLVFDRLAQKTIVYMDDVRKGEFSLGSGGLSRTNEKPYFRTNAAETAATFYVDDVKVGRRFSSLMVGVARKKDGALAPGTRLWCIRQSDDVVLASGAVTINGTAVFSGISTEKFTPEPCVLVALGVGGGDGSSVRPHLQVT